MHEYLNDHSVSLQSGDSLNILKPGRNGSQFGDTNTILRPLKSILQDFVDDKHCSNDGLLPNRRYAITWTNVDQEIWRHMMTMGNKHDNSDAINGLKWFRFDNMHGNNPSIMCPIPVPH